MTGTCSSCGAKAPIRSCLSCGLPVCEGCSWEWMQGQALCLDCADEVAENVREILAEEGDDDAER